MSSDKFWSKVLSTTKFIDGNETDTGNFMNVAIWISSIHTLTYWLLIAIDKNELVSDEMIQVNVNDGAYSVHHKISHLRSNEYLNVHQISTSMEL